ncbi:helix-turn-helix domain-containing protein [Nocardia carnea]|uniref:helix-turn-helix domain-containing protein n=1 Tax=Nocardia carnea TaxID=37328 RepID=UPI0024552CD7|nr:hypothetical protein [Nocardia carnea]
MIVDWTGTEVRALRTVALRCTQQEFAEITGFSEAAVRNWERRGRTITLAGQFAAGMDTLLKQLDTEQRERLRSALGGASETRAGKPGPVEIVAAWLPELRMVLDSHDLVDSASIRSVPQLRAAVGAAVNYRLNSDYVRLTRLLPELLRELFRARQYAAEKEAGDIDRLTVQALRATDAIAHKFGHHDLSARIIAMMRGIVEDMDDPALAASVSYVRMEAFFVNGCLAAGLRMLDRAADSLDPGTSISDAAAFGALRMRAAVVAARAARPDDAYAYSAEAETIGHPIPDGVYDGTAFGPASVRIHRVSLDVELGEIGSSLSAAGWVPPAVVPAERRSHFYIDLARAYAEAGRRDDAVASLREASFIAPQHTDNHPWVKELLAGAVG